MIITLDGPAGVGKTTLAKKLATYLKIAYLDSGAMFRGIAYFLGEKGVHLEAKALQSLLEAFYFELKLKEKEYVLFLNKQELGTEIRTEEIGFLASLIAKKREVREFLKKEQRRLAKNHSLVAEGRDMGSVVFPEAEYKFFLEASSKERARRRYLQLKQLGKEADFTEILMQIEKRDEQDRNREIAPLKPATGAIVIDTTELSLEEVFKKILDYLN